MPGFFGRHRPGPEWRDLAVLIAHYTATPRPIVDRYTPAHALAEREAIYRVIKVLNGNA